jgi:hypothetical protein
MCHRGQATARDPNELARRCQWRAVVVGRRVPVPSVMRRGGYHLSTTACSRDDAEESTCPWLNIARAPPPSSVVPRRLCAPWNLERPCESEAHLGRPLIISLLSVVRGVVGLIHETEENSFVRFRRPVALAETALSSWMAGHLIAAVVRFLLFRDKAPLG